MFLFDHFCFDILLFRFRDSRKVLVSLYHISVKPICTNARQFLNNLFTYHDIFLVSPLISAHCSHHSPLPFSLSEILCLQLISLEISSECRAHLIPLLPISPYGEEWCLLLTTITATRSTGELVLHNNLNIFCIKGEKQLWATLCMIFIQ